VAVELATAYISIVPETSKIAPGINKAMGGAEAGAEKRGRGIGGKLAGGLAAAAKAGMAATGAAVAAGFGTALVKGFGRLKAIEAAEAKLAGLGHSADSVATIMGNASAAVKGTAFGLGDAASAAASAVASGVKPGKDLERTLKLVGDAAAIAGADYGDMAAIFNKVSAGGIIQGEELAQLGDRGIPILQLLADELGVSALEVKKLASEGKVDFETFQNAMEKGMGGAALESGKTFQGAMNNVGAALGRLGANLLSGVFPKIAPMLQNVIGWLDNLMPVAEKVGKFVGDALSTLGEKVGGFFRGLKGDVEVMDQSARPLLELFGLGVRALIEAFKDGDVTSDGFIGKMEQVGVFARLAFDYIRNTAIPAVQGFIEQFRNGEGAGGKFRDILQGVYNVGKQAFTWIRDEGLPALQALGDFILNTLWPDIKAAIIDRVWPAMVELGKVIKRQWEVVIQPALKALWSFIKNVLAPFLVAFYHEGVKPTFDLIGKAISGAWTHVIKPTWTRMQDGLGTLIRRFTTARDDIKARWDRVAGIVSEGWDKVKRIFDRFKDGLSSLRDRFRAARDGIRDVWRGLSNIIARPINAVIDKINGFLSGLKSALNKIPGVALTGSWAIRKIILDTASGTVGGGANVALASGGRVPGWSPHDRADNIPAMLTAGEYVLPVKATRSLMQRFGPGFLESLRRGLPGYASGGMIGGRGRTGGALDRAWEAAVDLWNRGKSWVKDLFDRLMPNFGGSWAGLAAKGAIGSIDLQKVADLLTQRSQRELGGSANAQMVGSQRINYPGHPYGWASRGLPWQTIWSLIQAVAPEARMTSNYRPGSITASGIPSLHGMGRAVDIVSGNMAATFAKIAGLLPWSQLYYSPMGGRQIGYRDAAVHRMHFDHIHAALADGGLVAPIFDRGGTLAPGLNLINNQTGGPEPLRNADLPLELGEATLSRLESMQRRVAIEAVREEMRLGRMGAR